MLHYLAKRLLAVVPVLLGVTLVVFLLIQLVPGDVARAILGPEATSEQVEMLHVELGLDQPLHVQYLRWLGAVLRGDLGDSIEYKMPVSQLVRDRLRNTLILGISAWLLSTSVGLIVGVVSAVRPYSLFDRLGMIVALLGNSMPAFWIGMLLLLVFAGWLPWFPVSGMYSVRAAHKSLPDLLHHLVLPAVTLGSMAMAEIARMTRSSMLEVLNAGYVTTARAKGLREHKIIAVHALRNAMLPIVTVSGLQLGLMLAGAVLTETVFSWPGLGRQLYGAITTRDLPVIQGSILVLSAGFVLINLLVDLLYAYIDPRIRLK